MQDAGGFGRRRQSLRVVEQLEIKYPEFNGLNLTHEVREGLDPLPQPDTQPALESQVVDIADEIEGVKSPSIKATEEDFDIFYLKSTPRIKCFIKSGQTFVTDSRRDIYVGPKANIVNAEPLIKNGLRVKFKKEGRVEGLNKIGEIEIYGVRLDSASDIECYEPVQSISFAELPIKTVGDPDFDLQAKATSGLPVNYTSSNPTVASIKRNRVKILAPGATTITAEQKGNEILPRATATQILTVDPAPTKK
jgi:hypothetical protein